MPSISPKDCVLEGGQTKEEDERHEILFNETLAEDEITRLLACKTLTKFIRHTATGRKAVGEFKRDASGLLRENLIIRGNNLLGLYTLRTIFRGRVKMLYIDPPYNTGNDEFGYNDAFNHSSWLTFMKNRLEIAHELLMPSGMMFVQCDETECAYLRVFSLSVVRSLCSFWIVVKQILMSLGLTPSKLSAGVTRTCWFPITLSGTNRNFDDGGFRKLSFVFWMMFVELTKNRKFG